MKKIINYIGSAKFALFISVLIIMLSIIGSFFSESSVEKFKDNFFISLFFNPNTHEFKNFATDFGLIDIYTTPLFIFLLMLFTLSLVICTIRLIPFAKNGFKILAEKDLKNVENTSLKREDIIVFFNKEGWKIHANNESNVVMVEQNKPGRYGVILTHLGIFLVLVGALIDYTFGYSGVVSLFENQTISGMEDKKGKYIPFGFDLTLNKFNIEYYENTYTASAFKSDVTITKDSSILKQDFIDVNRPLNINNIYFYQADYGLGANHNMDIYITYTAGSYKKEEVLKYGKYYQAGSYVIAVTDFTTILDDENKSIKEAVPAVELVIYNNFKEEVTKGYLVLKADEPTYIDFIDMSFHFTDLKGVEYSTISVKYNPGLFFIYLGGIFMCFGVIFIYFLNYTSISFAVENGLIKYNVFSQRKLSLVNPADKFYKFLKEHSNGTGSK